jgi:hypothetical protein
MEFLAARVRGRGVSVLSSCSHAGVVARLSPRRSVSLHFAVHSSGWLDRWRGCQ